MHPDKQTLIQVRADINTMLEEYFSEKISHSATLNHDYAQLWKVLSHLSSAGGKRLRPYMTVLAYQAFGGKDYSGILPIAVAQELLHLCLLIHDDIIDRDFTRYGVNNVSGSYVDIYEKLIQDHNERVHLANSAALLAGDLALSGAYEMTLKSSLPLENITVAQGQLSKSIFAVVGGELLDTESVLHSFSSVDALQIAKLKTASYSFNGPLITGASLAKASPHNLRVLADYAEALGIAFQLTDDLLGTFGDSTVTGKTNTGDLSEGKRTLLMQKTFEKSSQAEHQLLNSLVGKADLTPLEADKIRNIIVDCGAKTEIESLVDAYATKAQSHLQKIAIRSANKQALEQLIHFAANREK